MREEEAIESLSCLAYEEDVIYRAPIDCYHHPVNLLEYSVPGTSEWLPLLYAAASGSPQFSKPMGASCVFASNVKAILERRNMKALRIAGIPTVLLLS